MTTVLVLERDVRAARKLQAGLMVVMWCTHPRLILGAAHFDIRRLDLLAAGNSALGQAERTPE